MDNQQVSSKKGETSTTIPKGSRLQAIGNRSGGHRLGDDIVSTSRESLEKFIRELVKYSELNWRNLCDYVDSSMTSNVCLAQIANDAVYGKGFTPAQKDNADRRTAIYGHAIELINVVDNEQQSLGAYMFNVDRYATKNMGYDIKQYPNMLCIEGVICSPCL